MYYNPILRVNINMHTSHPCHAGTRWVRVALPCGLACHVASTRVPRDKYPLFCSFLINLNDFKIKINSDKFQKIPINCKNHNFQNTTPNWFKFVLLDQKLNNLSL